LVFALLPSQLPVGWGSTSSVLGRFGYGPSTGICRVFWLGWMLGTAAKLGKCPPLPHGTDLGSERGGGYVTCWVTFGLVLDPCDTRLVQSTRNDWGARGLYVLHRKHVRKTRAVEATGQHWGNKRLKTGCEWIPTWQSDSGAFNQERSETGDSPSGRRENGAENLHDVQMEKIRLRRIF